MFDHIIGHENAISRFRRMLERGTVPHAVLLHGARHLGKHALAYALAGALLETSRPEAHPDFRLVERMADEKTGKWKKQIVVDEVRALRTHLRMSAFGAGRKVVVVDEAELLSDGAANALLKTIEEPSPGTHVIMIAHDATRLLPTVRSRAAEVPVARLPDAVLREALGGGQADAARIDAAVRYAAGRPGIALRLAEDDDMLHWYERQETLWRALRHEPLHRRFSLFAELAPPRADREETIGGIRDAIALWEILLQRELRRGSSKAQDALRALSDLRRDLGSNVQPRLLLERLALQMEDQVSAVRSQAS